MSFLIDYSFQMCGPIWSANLHNQEFVQKMLENVNTQPELYNTSKRILGMLNVALEVSTCNVTFIYSLNACLKIYYNKTSSLYFEIL